MGMEALSICMPSRITSSVKTIFGYRLAMNASLRCGVCRYQWTGQDRQDHHYHAFRTPASMRKISSRQTWGVNFPVRSYVIVPDRTRAPYDHAACYARRCEGAGPEPGACRPDLREDPRGFRGRRGQGGA